MEKVVKTDEDFAKLRISTNLEWADFVATDELIKAIEEIAAWIAHGDEALNIEPIGNDLKPGYKVLFHGPQGTGKTLAATLLAKHAATDIYRVDLSMGVEDLTKLFDLATDKRWILFIDQADGLFGKEEAGYLLQQIEDFPGLVILSSNLESINSPLTGKFRQEINFGMPEPQERLQLWKNSFKSAVFTAKVDWVKIARDYTLSGGTIVNVLRYCALTAAKSDKKEISTLDIAAGINREIDKL